MYVIVYTFRMALIVYRRHVKACITCITARMYHGAKLG
jgi:hypothetical protein